MNRRQLFAALFAAPFVPALLKEQEPKYHLKYSKGSNTLEDLPCRVDEYAMGNWQDVDDHTLDTCRYKFAIYPNEELEPPKHFYFRCNGSVDPIPR